MESWGHVTKDTGVGCEWDESKWQSFEDQDGWLPQIVPEIDPSLEESYY